jgi:hypothetical protein
MLVELFIHHLDWYSPSNGNNTWYNYYYYLFMFHYIHNMPRPLDTELCQMHILLFIYLFDSHSM